MMHNDEYVDLDQDLEEFFTNPGELTFILDDLCRHQLTDDPTN